MSQSHSFCVEDAQLYGVECAILINHFRFWINQNKACKRNFFDGRTWMYQTHTDIAAIYPYWSHDTVQRIIKKLLDFGVIVKGNYNKSAYDRTTWYAFKNEEIFTITQNRVMENSESRNQKREAAPPIPDTNKDTNKDSLPPLSPPNEKKEEDFSFLSKYNFNEHEMKQLKPFSISQIKNSLKIAGAQKVKSSFFGLLLNILKNPGKWPNAEEVQRSNEQKTTVDISKTDCSALNRGYWTEILKAVMDPMIKTCGTVKAAQIWHKMGLRECGSYLEQDNGEKIFMKDASFLMQVENFFRKKDLNLKSLYDFIDMCKKDLQQNVIRC